MMQSQPIDHNNDENEQSENERPEWVGRWIRIILLIDAILLPLLVTAWAYLELRS